MSNPFADYFRALSVYLSFSCRFVMELFRRFPFVLGPGGVLFLCDRNSLTTASQGKQCVRYPPRILAQIRCKHLLVGRFD